MRPKLTSKRARTHREHLKGGIERRRFSLTDRDIFLIVNLKYATNALPLPQREVLKKLKHILPYRKFSERQLRRIVERALGDPRSDMFREVPLIPPVDWEMGKVFQTLLPGLHEIIVIPSTNHIAPESTNLYLGLIAAEIFKHRFVGSQAIGLGTGKAIWAFASFLELAPEVADNLKFFALAYHETEEGETGAEALMELIVRCTSLSNSPSIEGIIAPSELKPEELHWAFVCVEPVTDDRKQNGIVAKILNSYLTKEGLPPVQSSVFADGFEAVPLSLLQRMVQQGRGVVAVAGGKESAEALLAAYRAKKSLGLPFNFLVLDDACAEGVLRINGFRLSDVPGRQEWWIKKNRFLTAHLRYAMEPPIRTLQQIATKLSLSIKQVKRLLEDAAIEREGEKPILNLRVKPPSPEMGLEIELMREWNLSEIRVVPSFYEGREGFKVLGQTAIDLLISLIDETEEFTLGLGGGRAIHSMVESLDLKRVFKNLPNLKRLSICSLGLNPLPKVLGIAPQTLIAPLIASYKEQDRLKVHYYGNLKASDLDAVFIGIGSMLPPDSVSYFLDSEPNLVAIKEKLAAFLLFQFITHDGEILPTHWMDRLKAMPLTELREMVRQGKPVVIVAQGSHKAPAILAAYKAGLFNCLVVDRALAERLLSLSIEIAKPMHMT